MAKSVRLFHLGCRVNQYELAAMGQLLEKSGEFKIFASTSPDLCLINTCCVTNRAGMQSRQLIRQIVREFPAAIIIATGCYAQLDTKTTSSIEGLHGILGNAHKQDIFDFANCVFQSDTLQVKCPAINNEKFFHELPPDTLANRTRPVVKIQDGCDAFCSYCIVPFVRGRSRSLPPERILKQINTLAQKGFYEIVISGIHIGQYGLDLSPKTNLEALLFRLVDSPISKIRLSSIEPTEVTDQMIRLVAEHSKFCRHFHIPLQSGDNTILKKMDRTYTTDLFAEKVYAIRKHIPEAAIGADVIVGFPGETQENFERTFSLLKKLPVTYLHVFPYSSRPGTRAADLPNAVNSSIIKERAKRLRALSAAKQKQFIAQFVGKELDVILEERKDNTYLKGTSDNYISVFVSENEVLLHTPVRVRIRSASGQALIDNIL